MAFDISSFLTEGAQVPTGSAVRATQTDTVLPAWYTNYAQQLLANQNAVAAQPYPTYQGPRVAEFSPQQQQGFAMTGQAAGAYQPALTAATQATQGAMAAPGGLVTAQPYFTQAAGMSPFGTAAPNLQQGAQFTQQSAQALGQQAAQPYLEQAGQSAVADIGSYMNPYTEQVVNRIGELGARNLSENLMPAITSKYIQAGQLGYGPRGGPSAPSGMMTDTARALRDVNADVLAKQSEALRAGYGEAATLAQADLARRGQLAATAGQLGTQQQQALAQAGQQMGALGQIGGNLTAEQQQTLANIGAQAGQLAGGDITRQLAGAEQLGGLGRAAQELGLTGAQAVTGVGATQQQQAQKNLDVAYADFLKQQGYNQEQINNALATFGAVGKAVPTSVQVAGIEPVGGTQQAQPSTAQSIAGVLAGVGGFLKDVGFKI